MAAESDGTTMYAQATTVTKGPSAPTATPTPVADTTPQPTQGRAPGAAQASETDVRNPPTPAPPAPSAAEIDRAIAELVERPLSDGEQMASQAVQAGDPTRHLGAAFDALETEARTAGNAEDAAALAEGRQVAAQLMAEFEVRQDEARQLVGALSKHHATYMDQGEIDADTVERVNADALTKLRAEWGRDFDARLALARRAAAAAMAKAPWLDELIRNTAAGSDPALIRHFADIGLRQARKARNRK